MRRVAQRAHDSGDEGGEGMWRGTHTFLLFAPGAARRSAQLRGRNGLPHRAAE